MCPIFSGVSGILPLGGLVSATAGMSEEPAVVAAAAPIVTPRLLRNVLRSTGRFMYLLPSESGADAPLAIGVHCSFSFRNWKPSTLSWLGLAPLDPMSAGPKQDRDYAIAELP